MKLGAIREDIPSHKNLMSVAAARKTETLFRQYKIGKVQDQGDLGACVAYSLTNLFRAEPISQNPFDPVELYYAIRKDKGYHGEDGLRLSDAVDYVIKQGKVKEDLWTNSAEQVGLYIFNYSPVVLSIPWKTGMDEPKKDGRAKPGGNLRGFHAVMAYSFDRLKNRIWLQNQFGLSYGKNGCFYLTLEDLDKLMREGGSGCALLE